MQYPDPRRLEIPVKHNGKDIVVIARENNDCETIAYVYALTAEENAAMKAGAHWVYPEIILSSGYDENVHGELDYKYTGKRYTNKLNRVWATAQADAHAQAEFLKDK